MEKIGDLEAAKLENLILRRMMAERDFNEIRAQEVAYLENLSKKYSFTAGIDRLQLPEGTIYRASKSPENEQSPK